MVLSLSSRPWNMSGLMHPSPNLACRNLATEWAPISVICCCVTNNPQDLVPYDSNCFIISHEPVSWLGSILLVLPGLSYATTLSCKLPWAGKSKIVSFAHKGPCYHCELGRRDSPLCGLSLRVMSQPSWPLCGLSFQRDPDILSTWQLGSKRENVDTASPLTAWAQKTQEVASPAFYWPTHFSSPAQHQGVGK